MAPNISRVVEMNEPMTVQVSPYKDKVYAAMRYMYFKDDGSMAFGKNGINIPIEWLVPALTEMLKIYNQATGSTIKLAGENAVINELYEEGGDDEDVPSE